MNDPFQANGNRKKIEMTFAVRQTEAYSFLSSSRNFILDIQRKKETNRQTNKEKYITSCCISLLLLLQKSQTVSNLSWDGILVFTFLHACSFRVHIWEKQLLLIKFLTLNFYFAVGKGFRIPNERTIVGSKSCLIILLSFSK